MRKRKASEPKAADLESGQELCAVATRMPTMLEVLTRTGKAKAVEEHDLARMAGLVGVHPDAERNAVLYFFDGIKSARDGKARIEAAGIECKPRLLSFVVAEDGVPEFKAALS